MTGNTSTSSRSDAVRLEVVVDGPVWWKLTSLATRQKTRVPDLVRESLERVVGGDGPLDPVDAHRRAMDAVCRGWDDWSIAQQLGMKVASIVRWRMTRGFRPNPPGEGTGPI